MRNRLIYMGVASVALLFLLTGTPSRAAALTHTETSITLSGDIVQQDAGKLEALIQRTGISTVYLNSNGGAAVEGYLIGYTLMRNEVLAIVSDGDVCLSACAIAFLGAPSKVLVGVLGFHVAWSAENTGTYSEGMKSGQYMGALTAAYFFNAGYTAQLPLLISQVTDSETFLILDADDISLFKTVDGDYTALTTLPDYWLYERVADPLRMYLLTEGY